MKVTRDDAARSVLGFPFASVYWSCRLRSAMDWSLADALAERTRLKPRVPGPKPCQCHARSLPITVRWPSDVSETYTRSAGRVAFSHTSPAVPVPGLAGVTVNRDVVPASIVPTDGVEVKVSRGAVTVTLTLGNWTVGIVPPRPSV